MATPVRAATVIWSSLVHPNGGSLTTLPNLRIEPSSNKPSKPAAEVGLHVDDLLRGLGLSGQEAQLLVFAAARDGVPVSVECPLGPAVGPLIPAV